MHSAIAIALGLFAVASALTQAQIDSFISSHNVARSKVSPPAKTMPNLVWDTDLATLAQGYSDKCVWAHNPTRVYNPDPTGWVGENIYASYGSTLLPNKAVESWVGENTSYTYSTNGCSNVCGHYTQVVWANTIKVGCGLTYCASGLSGLSWPNGNYIVCDYYPGGNYNGQLPYEQGTSSCTAGTCATLEKTCGSPSDGCTGTLSCGTCPSGQSCNSNYQCQCQPQSCVNLGKTCGSWPDGCGGTTPSCGTCPSPQVCNAGACCTPATCAAKGYTCGSYTDGCGGTIACGSCSDPQVCDATGKCAGTCTTQTCAQRGVECGMTSDGCSPTENLNCGSCTAGTCVSGKCETTTTCTPTKTCAGRNCGDLFDGCKTISCGTCSTNQLCNSTIGLCDALSEWVPFKPDTKPWNWAMASTDLVQNNVSAATVEKRIQLKTAGSWVYAPWTTMMAQVKGSDGMVGLGLRYGQGTTKPNNGIMWKLVINQVAATADVYLCQIMGSNDNCGTAKQSGVPFSIGSFNNFTINFRADSSKIMMRAYLNTQAVIGGYSYWYTSLSNYPELGGAFVAAMGSTPKTFRQVIIGSNTTLHVVLQQCMNETAWQSLVSSILGIPPANVQLRTLGADAKCTKRRAGAELYNQFEFSLSGTETQTGSGLANQFIAATQDGTLSSMGVNVATVSHVVTPFEGVGMAAAAALSAGAIAGIVVGSVVAVAAVAAVAGFFVYAHTRPNPDQPIPATFKPHNPLRKTLYRLKGNSGVDTTAGGDAGGHQSITARAPETSS